MEASCRRAIELGLPAIAFTDHADFNPFPEPGFHGLDISGYHEGIERCRAAFPALRIRSGVELGEPHRFTEQAAAILAAGPLDQVLGSVHCVPWEGSLTDSSIKGFLSPEDAPAKFRSYLAEILDLLASPVPFATLAHLDYPKRYWPHADLPYREQDYEEEFRALLRAAAVRGTVLEVNTTRGADPLRGLCPGPILLSWWRQEGGQAVTFGSDAHDPNRIAEGFGLAARVVEAAGFKPSPEPTLNWRR